MRLKTRDADFFVSVYTKLLMFANKKLGIDDEKIFQDDGSGFEERVVAVRDAMWEDETCIQDYIDEVGDTLDDRELALLESWHLGINGQFLVGKNYKDYSLFIDIETQEMYGVVGSVEPIKNMTPDTILPVIVETALIPFEGKIIIDGFIGIAETMPQEMRWDLIEQINQMRKEQETIMDLEEHEQIVIDYLLKNHFDELEANALEGLEGEDAEQMKTLLKRMKSLIEYDDDDEEDLPF